MKGFLPFVLLSLMLVLPVMGMTSCLLVGPGATPGGGGGETEPPEESSFWHKGYVGSRGNADHPCRVNPDAEDYIYSDIIELCEVGAKASFTIDAVASDNAQVYILSFWKQVAGEWVLDTDAPNRDETCELIRTVENGSTTYTYVTTKEYECVRFCVRIGALYYGELPEVERTVVTEDGTLKAAFERLDYIVADRGRAYYDIFEGKTAYFIGDSLFAASGIGMENCWIGLLCDKYGVDYVNHGKGGCTVSDCENSSNPIINRYQRLPEAEPDFIVIEGGRNDFNKGAVIGSVDEKDKTTYLGALAMVVDGLREMYPNATIIAVSFWETNTKNKDTGLTSNEYVEAMLAACEELGIYCVNAYDNHDCPVNMTDAEFRAAYCMKPGDVCHLNADGMKLVMPFFEKELAEILGN